ncbi:hypothetical protein ACEPAF_1599 [Sanghuangporus sanghuang]
MSSQVIPRWIRTLEAEDDGTKLREGLPLSADDSKVIPSRIRHDITGYDELRRVSVGYEAKRSYTTQNEAIRKGLK